MKKPTLSLLLVLSSVFAFAQREIDEQSKKFKDRVYFGGGFGLSGGTDSYGFNYFSVSVSPTIGYMVTNSFSSGLSLYYQHLSYSNTSFSQYGFAPFVRQNFGQLFLYAEYQVLNTPTLYSDARKNYNRGLIGAGFTQPLGSRASLNAMGLYDVLYNRAEGAFASPWVFRVFLSF